jgi:hypothetical protein
MQMNFSSIQDETSLLQFLAKTDISVPTRTQGRKTEHTEKWTMCRLLSTLAVRRTLQYPLNLTHRDRPDFLLTSGTHEIGVEVTEAISKEFAAYSALAEREYPDVLIEPGLFRWGAPSRSTQEMRELLEKAKLVSDGWNGDSAEEEWSLYIDSIIRKKLADTKKVGYDIFPTRFLAIYDNLPLPYIYLDKAANKLIRICGYNWEHENYFESIFVEHGPVILEIQHEETYYHELNDLW